MRPLARCSSSVSSLALVAASATLALSIAAIACAGGLARASGPEDRLIPREEVPGRLAVRGYAVSGPVVRRGKAYLTHGTDRWGQQLRLVMDGRSGEIIGLRVIGRPQRETPPRR